MITLRTKLFQLFLFLCIGMPVYGQRMETKWKQILAAQDEGKPQTALLGAQALFASAQQQRNIPWMLRAYLTEMQCRDELSPDSFKVDLSYLRNWTAQCSDPVDKSMLSLVVGLVEMNRSHSGNRSWSDSLRVSAERQFRYALALGDSADKSLFQNLVSTNSNRYIPFIRQGKESDCFKHDLLSFYRKVILSVLDSKSALFDEVLTRDEAYYQGCKNDEAALQVALERDDYRNSVRNFPNRKSYLQGLLSKYLSVDGCAEVYRRLAELARASDKDLSEPIALLRKAMALYPHYAKIKQLKVDEQHYICPSLSVNMQGEAYPNQQLDLALRCYNIQDVDVCWWQLPAEMGYSKLMHRLSSAELSELLGKAKQISKTSLAVTTDFYHSLDSTIPIQAPLQPGSYVLSITPKRCKDYPVAKAVPTYMACQVSGLRLLSIPVSQDSMEWRVLDAISGFPVSDAIVRKYRTAYVKGKSVYHWVADYPVDSLGRCLLNVVRKASDSYAYQALKGDDECTPFSFNNTVSSQADKREESKINLFADRSLYRPGQKVQIGLLCYNQKGDSLQVDAAKSCELKLMNPHGKLMEKKSIVTDVFGKASTCFEIPKEAETGTYFLQTESGSTSFRVENYKRPTFEVRFDSIRNHYAFGDTLQVVGSACSFAGQPVQMAKVVLKSVYQRAGWFRVLEEENLQADTLVTDMHGQFSFQLPLVKPDRQSFDDAAYQREFWHSVFLVSAVVTSVNGESHQAETKIAISDNPLKMKLEMPAILEKECDSIGIVQLVNLEGYPQAKKVSYQISLLSDSTVCVKGEVASNTKLSLDALRQLPSGKYKIEAFYETLRAQHIFSLFSLSDSVPVDSTSLWLYSKTNEVDETHPMRVQFGTSERNAFVLYQLYAAKGRVGQGFVKMSNELQTWTLPYKKAYGDCMRVVFTLVKNGQVYQKQWGATYTKPTKKLNVEWLSFRDKSQPGAKEQWCLRLTLPDGSPADAQLMAVLYDASLDRLYPHSWSLPISFSRFTSGYQPYYRTLRSSAYGEFPLWKQYKIPAFQYDSFEHPYLLGGGYEMMLRMDGAAPYVKGRLNRVGVMMAPLATVETSLSRKMSRTAGLKNDGLSPDLKEVSFRTNFSETAFFNTQLKTNREGVVALDFTLPDAITEWHLLGVAHTRSMDYCDWIDKKVQVSKTLMVQPNLPRFVRVGDEASFNAEVRNLSNGIQKGVVYIELTDSSLMKVIYKDKRSFLIKPNESSAVSFHCKLNAQYADSEICCRMYAQGEGFTDGEQHLLPVLSNEVWVVDSRAVYLNQPSQTVSLANMLNQGAQWNSSSTLQIETIHNPMWLVMQALSPLAKPASENAIDLASAYYATALSSYLKGVQSETQKFASDSLMAAGWLRQLEQLQGADGGFSWFKGMPSSPYITQHVLELLLRLGEQLPVTPDAVRGKRVLRRAFYYLDVQALSQYRAMQQEKKKAGESLGSFWTHYLYLCTMNTAKCAREIEEARTFFLSLLPQSLKRQSIYERALSSVILARNEKEEAALQFLESVLEYSVCTEELGRYFDTPRAAYSWRNYRLPTQVMAIRALQVLHPRQIQWGGKERYLDGKRAEREMKLWLLNQRRTQQWSNSVGTADAIYALWNESDSIQVLKEQNEMHESTCYSFKDYRTLPKAWTFHRDTTQTDSPVAWASVTARSLVPLTETVNSNVASGLRLARRFYKRVVLQGKEQLVPLTKETTLLIGDELVCRYTFSADRDMDFVKIQSSRAATAEPVQVLSGYHWNGSTGYYQTIKDSESVFYIDKLRKGEYTIEEAFYLTHAGRYQTGVASIEGVYCPEFRAHTASDEWNVMENKE